MKECWPGVQDRGDGGMGGWGMGGWGGPGDRGDRAHFVESMASVQEVLGSFNTLPGVEEYA